MIRNVAEITLKDGSKKGFRTGMLAISAACTKAGCKSTEELFARISSIDMIATLALYYGSAYEYSEHNKLSTEFTMSDVADWLEDVGDQEAKRVSEILLESYASKNTQPPVDPGENQQQQ